MAKTTNISWTDRTFNPWIGCTKVSEECRYCYAEDVARKPTINVAWGPGKQRRPASEAKWRELVRWNQEAEKKGVRIKVFCASMADVFDKEAPPGALEQLFDTIRQTPHLDYQLLTKRPELIERLLRGIGVWDCLPLSNVWLGFTAGNQESFDKRWPLIRDTPAAVRFCSYEPALGPMLLPEDTQGRLHWFICGGETHPKKYEGRRMSPDWARSLRGQCARKGIAFFFKQWGNWIPQGDSVDWHGKTSGVFEQFGDILDGVHWSQFPNPNTSTPENQHFAA